jgi:hypothetical protein
MKTARCLILALACLGLSGCIDIVNRFKIKKDGTGTVTAMFVCDPKYIDLKDLASLPPAIDGKQIKRTREMINGRPVRLESLDFTRASEVTDHAGGFSLQRDWTGVVTVTRTLKRERRPDADSALAQLAFSGRSYRLEIEVEGELRSAAPVVVNRQEYYPDRSGSLVVWEIPLSEVFAHSATSGAGNIVFTMTYR